MRTQQPIFLLLIVFLISFTACQSDASTEADRPYSPWVFRSVLDEQARMLTAALHEDLYVAYSAQTGALYKAWRGDVELDGAVYTTAHGPQPLSMGSGWTENDYDQPWKLIHQGDTYVPKIQFRGHRIKDGQLYVQTELEVSELNAKIEVSERPEYVAGPGGQTGLERVFSVKNVPDGAQLTLNVAAGSLPYEKSLQTDGVFTAKTSERTTKNGVEALNITGELALKNEGQTKLTTYFVKYPVLPNRNAQKVSGGEADTRPEGERLIERSGCKTCHNTYVRTVGPAYVAVAERYANTPDNVDMLVSKVISGGAGKWGQAAMTPHDHLPALDIRKMVRYIMGLDAEEESAGGSDSADPAIFAASDNTALESTDALADDRLRNGARMRIWASIPEGTRSVKDINFDRTPTYEGIIPQINLRDKDWGTLTNNFAASFSGYIRIPETSNYLFRLRSDDGSRLFIDGREVILHDGLHGPSPKDGELELKAGNHPFRLDYFEGGGGQAVILEWRSFFNPEWEVVPNESLGYDQEVDIVDYGDNPLYSRPTLPGDGQKVAGIHPAYDLSQSRPDGFSPKVGGMDFMSDGRLVVSTWDAEGAVYIIEGATTGDPSQMSYKKIATGLAEPLGLAVVEDTVYVVQKQEMTKLIDHDGDEIIDEYRTLSNDWEVSANFHEFTFGLAYEEPYLYATLAIAILPGGASADPQIPDRGKLIRVNRYTGETEFVATGLRTPNGVNFGVDGELFIADNQGDWLPASKILHVKEGSFFNSYAVEKDETKTPQQPVVWLPQDEIGNSPTEPTLIKYGPYAGQMTHGDVHHGGLKRVFVETVDGDYQGAVFRFLQGLEGGTNRLTWGPDSALYVGMVGSTGNWGDPGKYFYGLQRLKHNGTTPFEMLAVRAKSNGMEIELTHPIHEDYGAVVADYVVQQWFYQPTANYGGPKINEEALNIRSVNISEDRKKIFLELDGMKEGHVVYLRLPNDWTDADGEALWSTESWYTLNNIPAGSPGFSRPVSPPVPNTLSAAERSAGWQLLFNGENLEGWHKYGGTTPGSGWKVNEEGSLYLDIAEEDGGYIVTDESFDNYELRLDWNISACGNSGIIYNVTENEENETPWRSGPEMQILDNSCHPDAKWENHQAGSLYDMIAVSQKTVKPAGKWNRVRLVVKDGLVEHWLNGRKVVEYPNKGKEWERMIANSKFKDMPNFGKTTGGKISLQDHSDVVYFRNIKIRELK